MFDLKSLLILVDVYNWAWHIASLELAQTLVDVETTILDIADARRLIKARRFRPKDFDVVLMYPWAVRDIVAKLGDNTVICVAGGDQLALKKAFIDICSRRFRVYGACNSVIKREIETWVPNKTVVVLSHGVDTEKFKPNPIQHEGFVVGWAGREDRPLKRFHLAEQITKTAGVKLKVAGYSGVNHYEHDDMPGFYNMCDCLLVTSDTEAHPMVVYEAWSCGLPVIATDVGDIAESLVEGVNGFLLDVDHPVKKAVNAIELLRGNMVARKRMGVFAREMVVEKWGWIKQAEPYRDLRRTLYGIPHR